MGYLFFPDETPEQAQARRQANQARIAEAPAPIPGQQIVDALMGQDKQKRLFPEAPGGAVPSLGTRLANIFTFNHNGGFF